ncbi:hypothetical protein [Ralstonia pseudosolanacearum]|uniref:hypothetical protein n=1 Tax=Ralstonia pseudosolanacearum TaxID=1310165 RepID=UPI003CF869C6
MAVKPVTERKAKPSISKVDREIGKKSHDELVNWLIANRDDVVEYQFGFDNDRSISFAREALQSWLNDCGEVLGTAREVLGEEKKDSRLVKPIKAFISRAEACLKNLEIPSIPEEFGGTSILKWNSQHEIHAKQQRYGQAAKLVGYIDLYIKFKCEDRIWLSSSTWPSFFYLQHSDSDERREAIEDNLIKSMDEARLDDCQWSTGHGVGEVYFDVRSELTTLGETLQSLKSLRDNLQPSALICLFSIKIPDLWADVLKNEGFYSLSQSKVLGWISG